ncbi:DUF4389 domain-containing protein [Actinoplanes auranticolor]|uniref:DUF4389 domain-containing protein n=1 Tax=Actinoplanes auranticolor TaxID=47988 RepID=A0A919VWL1_9ACTN|nr:DUF4389 domain-containing protein [Actinoplanes auranticolor]GIM77725.1 hypothetical protein Aau02nite_77340 [Actinoplanes auranticolor]
MNRYPLRVEARRDESLSRWLWLVKWALLIPHYLVLAVLWVGFIVLTLCAYLAVLFTGRYPSAIRAYNLAVLRWTWRVNYYGYQALGTDRYPPFTLADVPDYPARLQLTDTPSPPRWLPLVAWLLAVPHILLLGALGGAATWTIDNGDTTNSAPLGVVTVGILIAGLSLLLTSRYPRGLYDLLVGVARWNLRVVAYLALLTPAYPPFRLDQGDTEPDDDPDGPARTGLPAVRAEGAPGPQPAPPVSGSVAGAVTALVAGAVLLIPAAGLGAAGTALLAFDGMRDSSGYVTSPVVRATSSTAAITADGITIEGGDFWARNLTDVGGVRITVASTNGKPVFVGIGRQAQVESWLSGTARDSIVNVSDDRASYDRTAGAVRAVPAPPEQDFWLASGTGAQNATLEWQAADGNYTVVLANADGSVDVATRVRASAQIPDLSALGGGVLGTGIVLAILGIGLIVLGGVTLGRRHSGPSSSGEPPVEPPRTGPPPPQYLPPPPAVVASA